MKSIPETVKPNQKVVLRVKTKRDGSRHHARALASECGADVVEQYGEVYVFLDVMKFGVEDESGKVVWRDGKNLPMGGRGMSCSKAAQSVRGDKEAGLDLWLLADDKWRPIEVAGEVVSIRDVIR